MGITLRTGFGTWLRPAFLCCLLSLPGVPTFAGQAQGGATVTTPIYDSYLPIDHWAYGALDRLRGLGYLDEAFLGIRPWTRRSIGRMLDNIDLTPQFPDEDPEALELVAALRREFPSDEEVDPPYLGKVSFRPETVYARVQGIHGQILRDSWHLGQSYENDYARPYQSGFNAIQGQSGMWQAGRFNLYLRGEYQHAPSAAGYTHQLAQTLWAIDLPGATSTPRQRLIPEGPIPATNQFRMLEANVSVRVAEHQISFGKSDHWLSPAKGGSFAYSNNAEAMYAFQIDRTVPLTIPVLSSLTGPFRYTFFIGSLKGHTTPNSPFAHVEKISFKPYRDLELGFTRTILFGGRGHSPVTLHTFLKGFFHLTNTPLSEKLSRDDPGARFSMFDLNWRLPWLRHWLTFYVDGLVHDDVSPISAPRHAGVRPGLYLSRLPVFRTFDLRVEGWNTDPQVERSVEGAYLYAEFIHRDGYTNQGFIMGDFAGREGKGGQAWLGWHPSPQRQIQLQYRYTKAAKDFVPLGTTQHLVRLDTNWRIHRDVELQFQLQRELWKAPIYLPGQQGNFGITGGIRWYPKDRQ